MKKEYQTFVRQFQDLKEGTQRVFIKDLTPGPRKYDAKYVKARVSRNPKKIKDGDILWIRSESGILFPQPWGIKILEDLSESVPGQPWNDVFKVMANLERAYEKN